MEDISILQSDYHRLKATIGDQDANLETITGLYRSIRRRANSRLVAAWGARHGTDLEGLLEQEQRQLADRLLGALHAHILAMDRKGGLEEAMAGIFTYLRLFRRIDALERAISGACEASRTFASKALYNIIETQGILRGKGSDEWDRCRSYYYCEYCSNGRLSLG